MIRHYIVTRFNIRIKFWDTTKNGARVLTDEWLQERFDPFKEYCLPSVQNQSDQDFTWCIYLDGNTQKDFRVKMEEVADLFKNIRLFYVNDIPEMITSFQNFTQKDAARFSKDIITSRLDNDDILHRDFIKRIKAATVPGQRAVIDLGKGFQLCIEKKHAELRCIVNAFNPFISLVEDASKPETVISRMHCGWEKEEKIIVVEDTPLWIELVHQTNKLNAVNNQYQKLMRRDLAEFGLQNRQVKLESEWKILQQKIRSRTKAVLSRFKILY